MALQSPPCHQAFPPPETALLLGENQGSTFLFCSGECSSLKDKGNSFPSIPVPGSLLKSKPHPSDVSQGCLAGPAWWHLHLPVKVLAHKAWLVSGILFGNNLNMGMASQGFIVGGIRCRLPLSARFGCTGFICCLGILSPDLKVTVLYQSYSDHIFPWVFKILKEKQQCPLSGKAWCLGKSVKLVHKDLLEIFFPTHSSVVMAVWVLWKEVRDDCFSTRNFQFVSMYLNISVPSSLALLELLLFSDGSNITAQVVNRVGQQQHQTPAAFLGGLGAWSWFGFSCSFSRFVTVSQ